MTLARLLAAALLLCSLLAFAQDRQQGDFLLPGSLRVEPDFRTPAATPSEPWRIVPNNTPNAGSQQDALSRLQSYTYHPHQTVQGRNLVVQFIPGPRIFVVSPEGQPDSDHTCLSIRSYVVARDSRDSDSTHPVSYSTCQLSKRYQVRSADIRVNSRDH